MKQETKKFDLTLHSCNQCPHLDCFKNKEALWVCCHDDGEGTIISFKDLSETKSHIHFPSWCPLPENKKGPGVRVGLVAIIMREGRMLFGIRKNTETANGQWAFPGGRMDYGETPEDGICREIKEETGLVVDIDDVKFLTYKNEFFPNQQRHYISLIFFIETTKGEPECKEPDKCEGWEWLDPFNLPENTFWACKQVIKEKEMFIKAMALSDSSYISDEEITEFEAESLCVSDEEIVEFKEELIEEEK